MSGPGRETGGPPRTVRRIRFALIGGALVLGAAQLIQPGAPRPSLPGDGPMTSHLAVSPEVEALLRRACFDCHSHETRWPWYSKISPLSWYIVHDVEHGLSNLDFSRWSTDPVREPTPVQRLTWICREARERVMPPAAYRFMHPDARLSPAEEATICAWTERARAGLDP